MWPRFGIKIGNSSLCIACVKADGKLEVIANKQGDRVSQACLFAGANNEIECGLTAKQKMYTKPAQTVCNSLQFFLPDAFLTEDKISTASKEIECEFDSEKRQFKLQSRCPSTNSTSDLIKLSPHDVCVHLFKTELELARGALSDNDAAPIAVLSIPHYYPKESWPSLAAAAEEAGFCVAQVIAEPTAALLAYGIGEGITNEGQCKFALCIKSGGLFSDFTLYEVLNGFYSVIDSAGPYNFGGKLYTEALVEYVAQEFYKKYKLDPKESRRSISKIRNAAINFKHILTTLPSTQIYIDSLMDGVDFNLQMSRARYESLIQPIINNFMCTLDQVIATFLKNHENVKQIDEIVLLGGTMRIPKLQSVIENRFPDAKMHTSFSADEVVSIGCARQASLLIDPNNQDITRKEKYFFTDSDLVIWHGDDEQNAKIVFKRGTIVPNVTIVEVRSCPKTPVADTFHIKIKDDVREVCMTDVGQPKSGVFKIEAEISSSEEDSFLPIIVLRCL